MISGRVFLQGMINVQVPAMALLDQWRSKIWKKKNKRERERTKFVNSSNDSCPSFLLTFCYM